MFDILKAFHTVLERDNQSLNYWDFDLKNACFHILNLTRNSFLHKSKRGLVRLVTTRLRWFETVFHFPFQLNFMKGLLVCSKRLLLLVDSRCCNNLSTYQLLYCHWHFGCHGNLTGPQIHPISTIQLHFTQKVVGELPFLLHQNCLHIKEYFFKKV